MAEPRDQWDQYVERANSILQGLMSDAQDALASGRRSLDEFQAKRETEKLLAKLGAATYAEQRGGGSPEAVAAAMAAIDAHVATYGWVGMPPEAVVPPAPAPQQPPQPEA
jgi:hypothetical protein